MGTNFRLPQQDGVCVDKDFLRRCGRPRHCVRHVDVGTQDIMFGCASVEIDPRHASLTPAGNSFEQEID